MVWILEDAGMDKRGRSEAGGCFVDIESGPHLDLQVGISFMESWFCKGNGN